MGSPRPEKLIRLTALLERVLCKAYRHEKHRVLGEAPRVKETLVHFGYITYTGLDRSGHEQYVLTKSGIERAAPLAKAKQAIELENKNRSKERNQTKIKAALYDDIVDTMVNPEIGTKTIDLLNEWRVRFDRSGPNKLVIQVSKQRGKDR